MDAMCERLLSFDYLSDQERLQILSALENLAGARGAAGSMDVDRLRQTVSILEEWKMPGEALLRALAAYSEQRDAADNTAHGAASTDRHAHTGRAASTRIERPYGPQDQPDVRKPVQKDRLRHLFREAYDHLEHVLLLLASHLAQVRRAGSLDLDSIRLLAEDNQEIFLPLVEMLGMWQLRRELGDFSLRQLNTGSWSDIRALQERERGNHVACYQIVEQEITSRLKERGIDAEIELHQSPPSSLYRRMKRGEPLEHLVRKAKVNLVVGTIDECYLALGVVHQCLTPKAGRTPAGNYLFRDLIASSKFNGYRALITTVACPSAAAAGEMLMEFRIYTRCMAATNALGAVAVRYWGDDLPPIKGAWWEDEKTRALVCSRPFGSASEPTYVFSPVGEVHILPKDSTPIDYAYRIHSYLGYHCKRIWVNGRPADYNQKLKNGDLVEIEADPSSQPATEEWLAVVRTSSARRPIKRFSAQGGRPPHKGRQIIDKVLKAELTAYELPDGLQGEMDSYLEKVSFHLGYPDVSALYAHLAASSRGCQGRKPPSPHKIVSHFIASRLAPHIVRLDGEPLTVPLDRIRFAQCYHDGRPCRVQPGSEIVGRLVRPGTERAWLTVYRKDCRNAPPAGSAIPLGWLGNQKPGEPVSVNIEAVDRPGLLGRILQCIYDLGDRGAYLIEVHAGVTQDRRAQIALTLDGPDQQPVRLLHEKLTDLQRIGVVDSVHVRPLSPIDRLRLLGYDRLPNPYTPQPASDSRIFKGRDAEIETIVTSLRDGARVVVLYGAKRIGKTSLLEHLRLDVLQNYDFVPVLLNLPGLPACTEACFWNELGTAIQKAMARLSYQAGFFHATLRRPAVNSYSDFQELLGQAETLIGHRKLLLLIDEFGVIDGPQWNRQEAARIVHRLKALVEGQGGAAFILCVQPSLLNQPHPKDGDGVISWPLLKLGRPVKLGCLDRLSAERLIREPVGPLLQFDEDEAVVGQIIDLTAQHPYYLQCLLGNIIDYANAQRPGIGPVKIRPEHLKAAMASLLDNGDHYFHDFLEMFRGRARHVLSVIARLECEPGRPVTAPEIAQAFVRHGGSIRPAALSQVLEALVVNDIVCCSRVSDDPAYRIRVPLFSRYVREHYPFQIKGSSARRMERNEPNQKSIF